MDTITEPRAKRAIVLARTPEAAARVVGMSALERLVRSARRVGVERLLLAPVGGDARALHRGLSDDEVRGDVLWLPETAGPERARRLTAWMAGSGPVLVLDAATWLSLEALGEVAGTPVNGSPVLFAAAAPAGGEPIGAPAVRLAGGGRVAEVGGAPGPDGLWSPGAALFPESDVAELHELLQTPEGTESLVRDLARRGRLEHRRLRSRGWRSLHGEGAPARAERALLHSLIKDSDGYMARNFDRYISTTLSRRLVSTSLTPNAITVIATVVGLLAAAAFAGGSHGWAILGGLLFVISTIIDGCDGEVARLRMVDSKAGFYFDMAADNVVYLSIFTGITLGLARIHPGTHWSIPCGVLLAGLAINTLVCWIGIIRPDRKEMPPVVARFERIANGDFSYIVLLFALAGHMEWFLWSSAIGAHVFWLALAGVLWSEARAKARAKAHAPA
ncbi:MAG: CDP-alcohol phosphatidyltransferase family protein [Planctomycetes bacterium]|nr:CDP-alcohol phosphatidyltransferase family protein [Planctomycetota bacterium]